MACIHVDVDVGWRVRAGRRLPKDISQKCFVLPDGYGGSAHLAPSNFRKSRGKELKRRQQTRMIGQGVEEDVVVGHELGGG